MQIEWLGRYRRLVEKIIKYGNAYVRTYNKEVDLGTGIKLSAAEIQTLEYVLENEENKSNMAEIAARLGVSPSVFSRYVRQMLEKGLLERYHTEGNKKDVIIQASEYGREIYLRYCEYERKVFFEDILTSLDGISQEHIDLVTDVLDKVASSLIASPEEDQKLVKMD